MFAMLEAKLPPPRPAAAPPSRKAQKDVRGSETSTGSASAGMSSSRALTTVQFRPPKRGTANV
jgi:hypothetical protein